VDDAVDAAPLERRQALASLQGHGLIESPVLRDVLESINARHASSIVHFVNPDIANFALHGSQGHLATLRRKAETLAFPLNIDNVHWALLVKSGRDFHFYDSFPNERNTEVARHFSSRIHGELHPRAAPPRFTQHAMPAQRGNDCAVNVLALCDMFERNASDSPWLRDVSAMQIAPHLRSMSRANLHAVLRRDTGIPAWEKNDATDNLGLSPRERTQAQALQAAYDTRKKQPPSQLQTKRPPYPPRRVIRAKGPLPLPVQEKTILRWNPQTQKWNRTQVSKVLFAGKRVYAMRRGGFVQYAAVRRGGYDRIYYPPTALTRSQHAQLSALAKQHRMRLLQERTCGRPLRR
jgi:hypothetical protein